MHFYGTHMDDYLSQIDGLESAAQKQLRDNHAISNSFLVDNIMRPAESIWPAKGGVIKPDINNVDEFEEKIKNVRNGVSLKKYLRSIWFDKFVTDPNGLLFVEVVNEEAKLTQKGIDKIKNMKYSGVVPEYVVFEPHKIEDSKSNKKEQIRELWIVDDSFYYRVSIAGNEGPKILESIPNSWGQVPATSNSPILDTDRKIYISFIWRAIDLFGKYLENNSVKEIHQFLHGYPIFWEYVQPCNICKGTGKVSGEICGSCGGTGQATKKDVSDQRKLRPPQTTEDPVIAPNVAGYVSPDIASWQEQRTELDWTNNQLHFSIWGTTTERLENETATGRFIDVQPVNNKLNFLTDIIEGIHKRTMDLLGEFWYNESYSGSTVVYGRRFLIETPDQIWNKYVNAKEKKAPISALDQLLEQYYDSEYQNNELLRLYYIKLIKLEPFVHESIQEVEQMGISEESKNNKRYFGDWIKTMMTNEIIDLKIDTLQEQLKTYSNGKAGNTGEAA